MAATKTEKSNRTIALNEWLYTRIAKLCVGDPERYLFSIQTDRGWKQQGRKYTCRSDQSIQKYFLKPVAEQLGLYRKGFGWHELRREAVTEYADRMSTPQAGKLVGHGSSHMTDKYVKRNVEQQRAAMDSFQTALVDAAGPSTAAVN